MDGSIRRDHSIDVLTTLERLQQGIIEARNRYRQIALGDVIASIAEPIAKTLKMPCIDPKSGKTKAGSGCGKMKARLNAGMSVAEAMKLPWGRRKRRVSPISDRRNTSEGLPGVCCDQWIWQRGLEDIGWSRRGFMDHVDPGLVDGIPKQGNFTK